MLPSFVKIRAADPLKAELLNRVQDNVAKATAPVASTQLLDGVLILGQAVNTGINHINHGLGRALVGWIVVRQDAASSYYDTQASNATPALTLDLVGDTDGVTISLWVF